MKKLLLPLSILFSGACWYLSFDLHLHWWWPIWFAPIPLLYTLPTLKWPQALLVSFIAMFIGRLAWLPYLASVLPPLPTILFAILLPLVFAILLLPVRRLLRTAPPALAIISFPATWTAFEFITFLTTRDGTILSFAYTQYDLLPLMQLASLTGITGITFLICLIPSAIAHSLRTQNIRYTLLLAILPTTLALLFGLYRLNIPNNNPPISIGMVCLPQRPAPSSASYLLEAEKLANQGAQIILLPEKVLTLTDSTDLPIADTFRQAARQLNTTLILGCTGNKKGRLTNQAHVFSPQGTEQLNYIKVHLFEGEAFEGFQPGNTPGAFTLTPSSTAEPTTSTTNPTPTASPIPASVAICKDLDFHAYIHSYPQTSLLFVPAWDFDRDGWWHSRIALTRGIENGYPIARNALQGRLTLSDEKGRLLAESNSEKGDPTILLGKLKPSTNQTLYHRWGDWFGWLIIITALIIHLRWSKLPSSAPRNAPPSPDR
ncbi:MAG: hypothetical protein JST68_13630 [Bacteroidetes bacterium]|nr:hypothetical protein [Bacteroidota bacterium]